MFTTPTTDPVVLVVPAGPVSASEVSGGKLADWTPEDFYVVVYSDGVVGFAVEESAFPEPPAADHPWRLTGRGDLLSYGCRGWAYERLADPPVNRERIPLDYGAGWFIGGHAYQVLYETARFVRRIGLVG